MKLGSWLSHLATLLLWGFVGMPITATAEELREFKSADGSKTLKAKVISASGGKFNIELEGGKKMTVPATAFSAEDQEFLKEWAASHVSYNFRAEAKKTKEGKRNGKSGNWEMTTEDTGYTVVLENLSSSELEGLEVHYVIYRLVFHPETSSRSDAQIDTLVGKKDLATVKAKGETTFTSETVPLIEWRLDPNYYVPGGKSRFEDKAGGFWMKVYHKDTEVFEYKTNDSTLKDARWEGSAPGDDEDEEGEDKSPGEKDEDEDEEK